MNEQLKRTLDLKDLNPDPIEQFRQWLDEAWATVRQANAMTLATSTPDGRASARIVLLKEIEDGGFVFYGNHQSRKGEDLEQNSRAALVFWWDEFERQVRVEGTAHKVSDAEADEYFRTRPRGSQLGAWASHQSRVVRDRDELDQRFQKIETFYEDQDIPRPPYWGGWRLIPECIEFWQGRADRMHDRLIYHKQDSGWRVERLAP